MSACFRGRARDTDGLRPDERGHLPRGPLPERSDRGVTLTELTVIGVLATMVMLALTGFYFNSQQVWVSGSTKAIAQRDATILVEEIRQRANEASDAVVDATADPLHHDLTLKYEGGSTVQFEWHADDSRIHRREDGTDEGAVAETPVTRFQLTTLDTNLVELTLLEMRSESGDSVRVSSRFALLGK